MFSVFLGFSYLTSISQVISDFSQRFDEAPYCPKLENSLTMRGVGTPTGVCLRFLATGGTGC